MLCSDFAPPDLGTGRYLIDGLLHESPQASLYRGRETLGDAAVVLKCFEAGTQRAYLREASAALGVIHPRIARCLDTFQLPSGGGCLVYEFLAGGTLAEFLETHGALAPEEVRRCLRELAEGLVFLHRSGRIHCDIKPANVFLRRAGDAGPAGCVLGDLGAVCFIGEARSGRNTPGTPAYIAPERVYDRFYFNSDLYSLGVLGFELATGTRPYAGSAEEVIRAHVSTPPPLHRVADPFLREILETLLEKDPQLRLRDAVTVLALLNRTTREPTPRATTGATGERARIAAPLAAPWLPRGVFDLPADVEEPARLAAVLEEGGQPYVVLDHGRHGEILAPGSDHPGRVFAKTGPLGGDDGAGFSYASSSRVFRLAPAGHAPTCVRDGCRGLIKHVLAHDHLFWQSRHSLNYVDLVRDRSVTFRARAYLTPLQVAIHPDGRFCHSDGLGNEQLLFRSAEAEVLGRSALPGPILALAIAGDEALAVTVDLPRSGLALAGCSVSVPEPRTLPLPPDSVDWCCAPGRVFWLTPDGQAHAADRRLEPIRLAVELPGATSIQVSGDLAWLALLNRSGPHRRLALWKTPQPTENPVE